MASLADEQKDEADRREHGQRRPDEEAPVDREEHLERCTELDLVVLQDRVDGHERTGGNSIFALSKERGCVTWRRSDSVRVRGRRRIRNVSYDRNHDEEE